MPALDNVGQYVSKCRELLLDQNSPYRYSDAEIVEGLNIGLQEARRLRADLFLPKFTIPYTDTSGSIDLNTKVPIDQMYRMALVYYVVGQMQLRDDEETTDARAGTFIKKFQTMLLSVAG